VVECSVVGRSIERLRVVYGAATRRGASLCCVRCAH
jgi:hypothetical protein